MNLDFHYYGTYMAACIAGYNEDEAEIIAYAAELVDDNTIHTLISTGAFEQIPTCRLTKDILMDAASIFTSYNEEDTRKAQDIWGCFHFLPGNQNYSEAYHGKTSAFGWSFDKDSKEKFKQMCIPNSALVREMLQKLIHENISLEEIGLKMHVLADTWSHAYFAGIPEWSINDVRQSNGLFEWDQGKWCKINGDIANSDNPQTYTYQLGRAASARYVSPFYLGHGQLGCIPDYGYMRYRYMPVWRENLAPNDAYIEKDNQQNFRKAFRQMVNILSAIRNHTDYIDNCEQMPLDSQIEDQLYYVLSQRKTDQSEEWITAIRTITGRDPRKYVLKKWSDECQHSSIQTETHYCRFHIAAKKHRDWVKSRI